MHTPTKGPPGDADDEDDEDDDGDKTNGCPSAFAGATSRGEGGRVIA
jgi:hypothetical protein